MEFINKENVSEFILVEDATSLLPILKNRLPKSCHVYNMAMRKAKFSAEMTFYTLGDRIDDSSWIVATYVREDCGIDINISSPASKERMDIMKEALAKSDIVSWNKPYIFAAIDRDISHMIRDLCVDVFGNNTCVNPCIMYYLNPEDCLEVDKIDPADNIEVKSLDKSSGGKFLFETWKFANINSLPYIHKVLERNESTGVYHNGELVSGVAVGGSGLMSMLYTQKQFRKRGFGKLCMLAHMKSIAANGNIPCCTVEYHNEISIAFQHRIGLKISHMTDFISYSGNAY